MNTFLLRNIRFATAILLLSLPLSCSDDQPKPFAKHVRVKYLFNGCTGPVLQIMEQRYAALGQKDFVSPEGEQMSAVVVYNNTFEMKAGEVYYVDAKRIATEHVVICDFPPYPPNEPNVTVALLKMY